MPAEGSVGVVHSSGIAKAGNCDLSHSGIESALVEAATMMRRVMVCIWVLLACAALPCAAQVPAGVPEQGAQPGGNQKAIYDPAEYNAYITALSTANPSQKAAAMEAFVVSYPNSAVQEDALEQALAAYQQAGNTEQAEKVARRILQMDENNVRALAIVVAFTRDALTRGVRDVKPADLRILAERGLHAMPQWGQPEGMAENDFEKLQKQLKLIFFGGVAFAALREKDYSAARDFYSKAVPLDPDDLQNTYQLSIADLEMPNLDVKGFWYVARAVHLCEKQHNEMCARMVTNYALAKYRKFHGSEEGWDRILRLAATTTEPPRDFLVARAAPPSTGTGGTAASLASNSNPGNTHSVPASILSSARTPAGIASPARDRQLGAPASVLSSSSDGTGNSAAASVLSVSSSGNAHSAPASVLSANSIGTGHTVPASVTSSTAARSRTVDQWIPASILHTASASATAVRRGISALTNSLARGGSVAQR